MKKNENDDKILKVAKECLPDCFCPVPFGSLILNPTGIVGSCREKGTEHELGNIKTDSLEEIWNGDKIRSWRREFLTGDIKTCKEEIKHNSCNRLQYNQDLLEHIETSEVVSTPIIRLSPDLNGKCNLRCPFCDVWPMPNGLYDEIEGFWQHLEEHVLPHVVQIDPLAGEPFIQKDLYKLIDIATKVNSTCEWKFTTNAQWNLTKRIKSYLDKININCISISLDSVVPETYKIVRSPGNLESALKGIQSLKDYRDQRDKTFLLLPNFSIQRENVYEIEEMINYCDEMELTCFIQYVYFPSELSPSTLPEAERKKILKFYLEKFDARKLLLSHRVLRALIDTLDKKEQKNYLNILNALTKNKFSDLMVSDNNV